jgi:mono/diheme cytochrome c family protein
MDASEENRMNQSQNPADARRQMKIIVMIVMLPWLASSSAQGADPQTNWSNNCVQCHGQDGSANTPMGKALSAKNLRSAEVQASFTDAEAVEAIKNGVKRNGAMAMLAFGGTLTDDEIKALVAYVRTLKQ